MAETIRAGIIGAGWPGRQHALGYNGAGGMKVVAVADLIPARREQMMREYGIERQYETAEELLADKEIDVVSVCLPTSLHASTSIAALRVKKHVVCEKPPAMSVKEARQMEAAATKAGKTLVYAVQRRFGAAEQAAKQAIEKGYAGQLFHARASWMRTRGIPVGTGWFTTKSKAGGGALIDIGVHVLDLAWYLLGQPKPLSVYGVIHHKFKSHVPKDLTMDVEDSAFAIVKFEGGKSLELATSWAFNQPPHQQGTVCRVHSDEAAIDVYTPSGPVLYRKFDAKGTPKATALKQPKLSGHVPLMRHVRDCIQEKCSALIGSSQGVTLMQMIDGIYKSAETGKSVEIK